MRTIVLGFFLAILSPAWLRSESSTARPLRILCLGESTTAPTSAPDLSWPRRLEDRLNRERPGRFVVLNHLPEADSAVIEQALPAYLEKYEPDLLIAMTGGGDPKLARTRRLVGMIRERRIPLVLMQYPGVGVGGLREAFKDADGVSFIDNKKTFDAARASGRYEDLFQDQIFGDWGHATPKGNLLIAGNAARAVLARFPGESVSVKLTAAQRADAYRRVAQAHAELDDEAGALGSLALLLELFPDDRDALSRTARINRDEDLPWDALFYADRAAAHVEAGELRLHLGDLSGAEANFERAVLDGNLDPRLPLLLAQARRERPRDALASALQVASSEASSPRLRAEALLLAGKIQIDLADETGAQRSLTRSLSLPRDEFDALHELARLKRGRMNEARAYAKRAASAAEHAPSWRKAAALRYSARIRLEHNDYAGAAGSFMRALRLNPDDFDALTALIRIKGKFPKGELLRAGQTANPETPEAKVADEGRLLRALENDENDLDALLGLIELAREQGRFPQAAALAHRFTRSVPRAPLWQRESAYCRVADVWLDLGRPSRAFLSLTRALELNPDSIAARRVILGLRRPVEEDSVFSASDVSGFANRYVRAAAMRAELGDSAGALASLQRALELSPSDNGALQLRALLEREAPH